MSASRFFLAATSSTTTGLASTDTALTISGVNRAGGDANNGFGCACCCGNADDDDDDDDNDDDDVVEEDNV